MATATAPAPLLTPTTTHTNGRATGTMRACVLEPVPDAA